jgi:alpha-glucosidase (family GH31 glycosyl hydrolase)
MWAKNKVPTPDDGFGTGLQSTGMHPFVLFKNPKSGRFGGMYFRNANNAAPIVRFNATDGTTDLSYITTGGKLEVYFFIDGTPEQILQRYQAVFGKPALPPFWALGWQQSSDVYNQQTDIETVLDAYRSAELPLETIWMSTGTMDHGMPFTVNNGAFMNKKDEPRSIL